MQKLLIAGLLATSAFAQSANLGLFTGSDDIGAPPIHGSAEYDASTKQYKITGSGADIWGKSDQFHYVWKEMSGNFAVTATAKFLTDGIDHRKAVIMLRQSLDADSPFIHLVMHGNGMPSVQFRNAKGATTNTVDMSILGAGTYRLKLMRQGTAVTVYLAKEGGELKELGGTITPLGGTLLVGLGVASHSVTAVNTVLFSDVTMEQLAASAAAAK